MNKKITIIAVVLILLFVIGFTIWNNARDSIDKEVSSDIIDEPAVNNDITTPETPDVVMPFEPPDEPIIAEPDEVVSEPPTGDTTTTASDTNAGTDKNPYENINNLDYVILRNVRGDDKALFDILASDLSDDQIIGLGKKVFDMQNQDEALTKMTFNVFSSREGFGKTVYGWDGNPISGLVTSFVLDNKNGNKAVSFKRYEEFSGTQDFVFDKTDYKVVHASKTADKVIVDVVINQSAAADVLDTAKGFFYFEKDLNKGTNIVEVNFYLNDADYKNKRTEWNCNSDYPNFLIKPLLFSY